MRQKKNQFLKQMKKFIIFIYCGLCRDRAAEEKRIIVMIQMLSVWPLNGKWKLPRFQAWYILQWRKTIFFFWSVFQKMTLSRSQNLCTSYFLWSSLVFFDSSFFELYIFYLSFSVSSVRLSLILYIHNVPQRSNTLKNSRKNECTLMYKILDVQISFEGVRIMIPKSLVILFI